MDVPRAEILRLASTIVSAHLSKNSVPLADLPAMIRDVYDALASNVTGPAPAPDPAVPIKKSITQDYLICLDDGKKLKMLKRHLKTAYGMSPEDYRAKWGLNSDYPMVAPAYAKKRSDLAKAIGLGQARRKAKPKASKPKAKRRTAKK
jgi:predicted transcriptional regulator